ncbi:MULTISPECIES: pentalenene synthase [unclassified Streptomyces]|uniref:pentalenene synthase n=1 Tax=unclassified Streptomyces TaxID=2593676 RepID=UPI0022B734E6|nr:MULTISPECIES: terpene synthase family protein [unclassified Streptomyces]MCZ7415690.1 terpene synthase family protein [Streptomyces sp. WMMC897]MCZ7434499.1 terpene synthase family protein [Streptomyces sp. WMMC1477]
MPQDVDFHMPLPARQSPEHARAEAEMLAWPRSLGLITSEAAAERHLRGGYADLASRFYPHATGADLDLGVDLMSWFFLFDDLFDGPRGEDPEDAKRLTDAVAAALDGPLPASAPPIAHGFADLWRRCREEMTPAWCARSTRHWRNYFDGYVDEARSRFRNKPYDCAAEYLAMRRHTIGVQPTVDLAERAGRFEVPHRVFGSAVLDAMLQVAVDVNLMLNDIASLEKEEARGEQNNMIMILRREHGWSKGRSIAHLQDEVHARLEQFLLLESCLPKVGDVYRLDEAEREALERYRTDAVRTVIRGSYDWHRSSGRYDAEFAVAAGAQGYLEELGRSTG